MSQPIDTTTPAADIRDSLRRDLDAFEAIERKLLADERRERARQLSARFRGLSLQVAD